MGTSDVWLRGDGTLRGTMTVGDPRMAVSVFDLFKVGIGPSSSHTVGPMKAAGMFARTLDGKPVARVQAELFGSLGWTGKGHGSDTAVMLGLCGCRPDAVDPDDIPAIVGNVRRDRRMALPDGRTIVFDPDRDVIFRRKEKMPLHSNGMRFTAFDESGNVSERREYYSVGGGFVRTPEDADGPLAEPDLPYPSHSGADLLRLSAESGLTIAAMTLANETAWRDEQEVRAGLVRLWHVMRQCVERGLATSGTLPGGLKVPRRAPTLYHDLRGLWFRSGDSPFPEAIAADDGGVRDPLDTLDWVDLWALAVNEENAAGGRVVTAPTNGAAGIIPAVLHYQQAFRDGTEDDVVDFLLTAGAIGLLYKENASISGAEVGCQGEVGVACSMAAAGLAAVQGGTTMQIEQAAEIGMEHNLGLTCDPIGGLVQVPCIERNAMGAVKAINAARMALRGDGSHRVSLDKVIRTMRETGRDMSAKYKETSRGGLALNVIEC